MLLKLIVNFNFQAVFYIDDILKLWMLSGQKYGSKLWKFWHIFYFGYIIVICSTKGLES